MKIEDDYAVAHLQIEHDLILQKEKQVKNLKFDM